MTSLGGPRQASPSQKHISTSAHAQMLLLVFLYMCTALIERSKSRVPPFLFLTKDLDWPRCPPTLLSSLCRVLRCMHHNISFINLGNAPLQRNNRKCPINYIDLPIACCSFCFNRGKGLHGLVCTQTIQNINRILRSGQCQETGDKLSFFLVVTFH